MWASMREPSNDNDMQDDAGMPAPTAMWTRSLGSLWSESEQSQSMQNQESVILSAEMDEARWEAVMASVEEERRARCRALGALPRAARSALAADDNKDELDDNESRVLEAAEQGPFRAFKLLTLELRREFKGQLQSLESRLDRLMACCESAAESALSSHQLALDLKKRMESLPALRETRDSSPVRSDDGPQEKLEDRPDAQHWQWQEMQQAAGGQLPSQELEKQQPLKHPERPPGFYTERARDILSALPSSRPSDATPTSSLPSTISLHSTSKSSNLLWGLSAQNKFDIDSSSLATGFDAPEGCTESASASASLAKRARSLTLTTEQVPAPQSGSQLPPNERRAPDRRASSASENRANIEPRPQLDQRALSQAARSYTPRRHYSNHSCASSRTGVPDSASQDTLLEEGLQKTSPVSHVTILPVPEVGQCQNQQPETLPMSRAQQSHPPFHSCFSQSPQQQPHAVISGSKTRLGPAQTPPAPGLPLQRMQQTNLQTASQSVQALISPRVHVTGRTSGLVMHTAASRSVTPVMRGQIQVAPCARDLLR